MNEPIKISDDELHAYLDGELPEARCSDVATYLAVNPAAKAKVDSWRDQMIAIRESYEPVLNEPIPEALEELVLRHQGIAKPWRLAAIAALVACVFAGGFLTGRIVPNPSIATRDAEIADIGLNIHGLYVSEVRHAVEVGADQDVHLAGWLTKRVGGQIKLPDLTKIGLRLMGGRLVPAEGKPAALLMYDTPEGARFTLMIAHGLNEADTAFQYKESGKNAAFFWYSNDFAYVLSGPLGRDRLMEVSRVVYEELS